MIPVTIFAGRDVAVFGLGLSGIAAARALAAGGAEVLAWDDNARGARQGRGAEASTSRDLAAPIGRRFAALVLAPGIPLTHPEPHWSVEAGARRGRRSHRRHGAVLPRKGEAGARAPRSWSSPAPTANRPPPRSPPICCSCRQAGARSAAISARPSSTFDAVCYGPELCSRAVVTFQIDLTPSLAPDAAALSTSPPIISTATAPSRTTPPSRRASSITCWPSGTAVIGVDDDYSRAIADALRGPYAVKRIAVGHPVQTGVWAKDGMLTEVENGVERGRVGLDGIGPLRGAHNWQNAGVAYALARSQGLDASTIAKGLESFAGLAHRMEQVARLRLGPLRQRLQGHQCRCRRQGVGELHRHLLDCRRQAEIGRP